MIKYIFKRLIMLIPVILVTSFLIYWAMSLTGGDPALMLAGDKATPEQVEQIREELGLNDPFPVRYANYMKGMLTGDMGKSYVTKKDVFQTFMEKLPNTLALGGRRSADCRGGVPSSGIFIRRSIRIHGRIRREWCSPCSARRCPTSGWA